MSNKKPLKCCHPDCLHCPYKDCRYDRLEAIDYSESNNRDYDHHEAWTGKKLHVHADKIYQTKRQTAYMRNHRKYYDRHNYNQRYYSEHKEEICQKQRAEYNTKKNTRKCKEYRKNHRAERQAYEKSYYEKHKEEIKARARERYKKLIAEKEND